MEACSGAHHWARELTRLGHVVRLMPPAYVMPYLKRGKTDAADAEAICEAVVRPTMRFVPVKSAERQAALPFPLLGFDTDTDTVFMNETIKGWCEAADVAFTRSRPYRKNDQAHVEQKNGAVVRRMVGYRRYEGIVAARELASLYSRMRLFVNFFQPSFKLMEKTRDGARVAKRYHAPLTPFQRVQAHPAVSQAAKDALAAQVAQLDPVTLLHDIRHTQARLAALAEQALFAKQQRRTFRPARRHVGERQRLHEAPARRRTAMGHEVRLHVAGRGIVPVRVGADRHASPQGRAMRSPPAPTARAGGAHGGEDAVDARRADLMQQTSHSLVQREMTVPLHRRDQQRDQRLQPLAADPVRRLPENHKRLAHGVVVHTPFGPGSRPIRNAPLPKKALRMLSVITGNLGELRQDPALLGPRRRTIPRRHRIQEFVSRRHADPPHARLRSFLREHF